MSIIATCLGKEFKEFKTFLPGSIAKYTEEIFFIIYWLISLVDALTFDISLQKIIFLPLDIKEICFN